MKPRTTPRGGKPHTAPEHGHAVLSQAEQSKFLGVGDETVMNLGHRVPEDRLTEHPLNKVPTYDTAPQAERQISEGQRLTQGVYGRHVPIKSGISAEQNLDQWASYAKSNSYHRGPGPGKEPTVRDPRGGTVPSAARSKDSDGYLADPKDWASYEFGSEAGLGRLEKSKKY
jgi:hypothetical protein